MLEDRGGGHYDVVIERCDVIVVGGGPNGLAAAIEMARHGLSVRLLEAADTVGGGTRSAELTRSGFVHDVCSAIHPLGAGSPFFQSLPLAAHGLQWVHPPAALAHPFDDGPAAVLQRSVQATAEDLGPDGPAYRRLVGPMAEQWEALSAEILGPLRWPRHPWLMARFARRGLRSAVAVARAWFEHPRAAALLGGLSAHSLLPLERAPSAAFGVVLAAMGHAIGWPMPRGGSQKIADALAGVLRGLGGSIVTSCRVDSLDSLAGARAVLLDVGPRQLLALAGQRLPNRYRSRLQRYRYGPGVFKVDWALAGPIPWRDPACLGAGTVHLGGTLEEIAAAERQVWQGGHPQRPFVLLAQQSLFDPTRAPAGRHTGWAYCHVPNGSGLDMTERIERQVERFAPGFGDLILARHTRTAAELEQYNPNCVGGDINGGLASLRQLWARPTSARRPYATPLDGLYLCSASTPPGGGVHGLCGYWAARAALADMDRTSPNRPRRSHSLQQCLEYEARQ